MVMGCYYLTQIREGAKGEGKIFTDVDEALMAYQTGELSLQAKCRIRLKRVIDGRDDYRIVETTIGRVIFNEAVPQDMGTVARDTGEDMFKLEIDTEVDKKQLGRIVDACYRTHGVTVTAQMLDKIKALGFKYSTRGAVTVSVADIVVPEKKYEILRDAEDQVHRIEREFKRGRLSENERYTSVIGIWEKATNDVTKEVMKSLDKFNPINMMAQSGARGSVNQIASWPHARPDGLALGKIIELPIRANFAWGCRRC
jgi:DNA-directed RNA polymerase subunit beta'